MKSLLDEQKKLKDLLDKVPTVSEIVEIVHSLFKHKPTGREIKQMIKRKKKQLIQLTKANADSDRQLQGLQAKMKENEENYGKNKQQIADATKKLEEDHANNQEHLKKTIELNVMEDNLILQEMIDVKEEIAVLEEGQDEIQAAFGKSPA